MNQIMNDILTVGKEMMTRLPETSKTLMIGKNAYLGPAAAIVTLISLIKVLLTLFESDKK